MRTLKPDLVEALRNNLGDGSSAFERSIGGPVPVSIRINPSKPGNISGQPVPWCSHGIYLDERPKFTLDPRLHSGAYYVQEASSMVLEQCFRAAGFPNTPMVALDLCAAPGGKSTHLRSLLPAGSLLVSNEVDRRRASILCENLWKWGATDTVITNDVPGRFGALGPTFDVVLVDAPCSGEGLMRKDDFAVEQWSPRLVRDRAMRQNSIMDAIWPALKPGGVLIYSTCTFEPAENEDQVARMMDMSGALHIDVQLDVAWGMVRGRDGTGIRCIPPSVRGEGLFMAVLFKPGDRTGPVHNAPSPAPPAKDMHDFIDPSVEIRITEQEGVAHALGAALGHAAQRIVSTVRTIAQGTPMAVRKGNEWAPHAALALCPSLLHERTPRMDLNNADALRYLRGETLPAANASGHVLAVHEGNVLGWLKGAGNRWNNRWPAPWRIRMR
ncbi:MAG: rRNA cytosine-C5-methyltransferase [Flavobacteriales bacterium]|nr:MAG: rRNA cytosine-C5-methyltransferase [Flavobacteriales bacterium]